MTYQKSQLAKLSRAFTPEIAGYEGKNIKQVWFFYVLSGLFLLSLIIYIIGRFTMNRFKGPKSHISSWYGRYSFLSIIVGLGGSITMFSFAISNTFVIQ